MTIFVMGRTPTYPDSQLTPTISMDKLKMDNLTLMMIQLKTTAIMRTKILTPNLAILLELKHDDLTTKH